MKDGGRLAAAIEVLDEVERRHRPVQVVLKEWGSAHRFAGSGDRTVIGNLVFDALRNRASLSAQMQDDSPRALALATYVLTWDKGLEALTTVLSEDRHAPEPLTESEADRLAALAHELANLGVEIQQTDDGLDITGQGADKPHGAKFRCYADHRMAHAGALLGLVIDGIELDDIACTSKTMPQFPQMWADLVQEN